MKAMIFAAGLGTRLKPITDTIPKALLPLNGKTLLQYQIERLKAAGIADIVVNVHHFADQIIEYLEEHDRFGCRIEVSDERERLLDTGGGLRKAQEWLQGEDVLAMNVDILSNIDIKALLQAHQKENLATLVVSKRETQRYLLFDAAGRLRGWTNRSTGEIRPHTLTDTNSLTPLAFSGMQVLGKHVFACMDEIIQEKGEKFSLIDLYLSVCSREQIQAYIPPSDYRMMDVGKIGQLNEAERFAETIY